MMKKHQKGGRKWQEKLEESNLLNKFKDISRSFCMISHTLNLDMFLFPTLNFFNLHLPCLITRADIHLMQSKFSFVLIFHEGNNNLLIYIGSEDNMLFSQRFADRRHGSRHAFGKNFASFFFCYELCFYI